MFFDFFKQNGTISNNNVTSYLKKDTYLNPLNLNKDSSNYVTAKELKKPGKAYLDVLSRHHRLSEEIDKKYGKK